MPLPFPICKGCAQGAKNRLSARSGAGVTGKPRRGAGHRNTNCAHYKECLDLAAKRDWKTFNCENCEHGGQDHGKRAVTIPKKENTRLCGCGKITLSPSCPYCPACMSAKSRQGKSAKKEPKPKRPRGRPPKKGTTESPTEAPKKEKTTHGMPKPEKAPVGPNTTLAIDFGKCSSILRAVEKLAEEEMRPVDLQVVYILKHYLNERQADG